MDMLYPQWEDTKTNNHKFDAYFDLECLNSSVRNMQFEVKDAKRMSHN